MLAIQKHQHLKLLNHHILKISLIFLIIMQVKICWKKYLLFLTSISINHWFHPVKMLLMRLRVSIYAKISKEILKANLVNLFIYIFLNKCHNINRSLNNLHLIITNFNQGWINHLQHKVVLLILIWWWVLIINWALLATLRLCSNNNKISN